MDKIKENRIYYFDFLRVTCAFLIIYLHSTASVIGDYQGAQEASWLFVVFTNSFTRMGVTIFFMISGALMLNSEKNDSISYVLKNRVSKIFIQIIVWSIIYLLLHTFVWQTKDFNIVKYMRLIVNSKVHSHLWFMHTLLGLYIALPLLRVIVSKVSIKYLWYLFTLCFFEVYVRFGLNLLFKLEIKGAIPIATGFVGAFILGYLLNKIDLDKKKRYIIYLLGIISFLVNVYMTLRVSANTGTSVRSWLNSDNMTILFQASAFFVLFKYSKFATKLSQVRIIKNISNLTFGMYIIHPIFIFSTLHFLNLTPNKLSIPILLILFIFVSIASIILTLILSKIPRIKYLVT